MEEEMIVEPEETGVEDSFGEDPTAITGPQESDNDDIAISPESELFPNLAPSFSDEELTKIGQEAVEGFDRDFTSIAQLSEMRVNYTKIFDMFYTKKNYPYPGAANVMIPVLTTACTNFQARAYMNLYPPFWLVNAIPDAKTEDAAKRAKRVTDHLNWQLTFQMTEFFPGSDRMLLLLARDGYAFKKTYYDSMEGRVVSDYVLPQDFVVNYYCRDLAKSFRYTQVLYMNPNDLQIKADQGLYLKENTEYVLQHPPEVPELARETERTNEDFGIAQPATDDTTPYKVLEQHTYLNIDDAGFKKPVVILVEYSTRRVLRITSRVHPTTQKRMDYFTAYDFIPNPASIYGYGFGMLLYGINHTMNTGINQLLDAAHLQNIKGGFISKQSKMKRGTLTWEMGKFTEIDGLVDDIKKYIMPFEFQAPSTVLLQLVEYLGGYADKLTTVTEIFTGQAPRSDTTATAATLAVENGIKVFTAIQQRIHRAQREEIRKIAQLNSLYLDDFEYFMAGSQPGDVPQQIGKEDYASTLEIHLVTDPNIVSQQQIAARTDAMANIVNSNQLLAQDQTAQLMILQKRLESINTAPYLIRQFTDLALKKLEEIQIAQQQAAAMQAQMVANGQPLPEPQEPAEPPAPPEMLAAAPNMGNAPA